MDAVLGAGLAIGLAWLWVSLGEGLIGKKSLEVLGKNPELWATLRPITILGIALTESAAIYGLVVGLLIIFTEGLTATQGISAWLSIWLAWLAAGIGEGWIAAQALESIFRNPLAENEIKSNMILYIALVESAAIYALVVSLLILFT